MRGLVFSIDDAYVMPFKVLWHSLMKTESVPAETPVYILHEDTLTQSSVTDLIDFIGQGGFHVTFINANSRVPDDLPVAENDHVSKATFYRLYVASILPEDMDSVVYMDSDAVVIRSIKDLFEINLTHPIAAVDHLSPANALRLWGDNSGNYFQAGVLLIDLDDWRAANYEPTFARILAEDRHRILWWDQCVLNLAFEDNWQRLPVWFNVHASVRKTLDPSRLHNESRFLHLDGSGKPWKHILKTYQARRWYEAYQDAFGVAFNVEPIRRPLWKHAGSKMKKILRFVVAS